MFSFLTDTINEYRAMRLGRKAVRALKAGDIGACEELYRKALGIMDRSFENIEATAVYTTTLGELLVGQGRLAEAVPFYERSVAIWEKAPWPGNVQVAAGRASYADLLRQLGRDVEAAEMEIRIESIWEKIIAIDEEALSPDHPRLAAGYNNLAQVSHRQGRYPKADLLHKRAVAIFENALGPDHPNLATSLDNLAKVYQSQGRYEEAQPLCERTLTIYEKALGPDHPLVATSLASCTALLRDLGREGEAEEMEARAEAIRAERSANTTR